MVVNDPGGQRGDQVGKRRRRNDQPAGRRPDRQPGGDRPDHHEDAEHRAGLAPGHHGGQRADRRARHHDADPEAPLERAELARGQGGTGTTGRRVTPQAGGHPRRGAPPRDPRLRDTALPASVLPGSGRDRVGLYRVPRPGFPLGSGRSRSKGGPRGARLIPGRRDLPRLSPSNSGLSPGPTRTASVRGPVVPGPRLASPPVGRPGFASSRIARRDAGTAPRRPWRRGFTSGHTGRTPRSPRVAGTRTSSGLAVVRPARAGAASWWVGHMCFGC
jgi:hypothetical protein